jgi:hypothetical protein
MFKVCVVIILRLLEQLQRQNNDTSYSSVLLRGLHDCVMHLFHDLAPLLVSQGLNFYSQLLACYVCAG